MQVTLHIGTEKTGTTTVQSFLAHNRKPLAAAGVLVPLSLGETNHRLLPGIVNEDDFVDDLFRQRNLLDLPARKAAKARWRDAFIEEVREAGLPRVVISSEHLQSRLHQDSELERLRDLLAELFDEIRICVYLRAPLATAVSLYSTAVKYGSASPAMPGPKNPYFRNVIDHKKTLQRWARVFGREALTVRLFGRQEFVGGDLIEDFASVCDLPLNGLRRPERENESLSALGIALLSRINAHIPLLNDQGGINPARGPLAAFFEAHFSSGDPYTPPPELAEAYEAEFAEVDEWVRTHYFPERERLFAPHTPPAAEPARFDEADLDRIAGAMAEMWMARKKPGANPADQSPLGNTRPMQHGGVASKRL